MKKKGYWKEQDGFIFFGTKTDRRNIDLERIKLAWTEWYENGQMKEEASWTAGVAYGLSSAWHENGLKSAEVNFIDGS